MLARAERVAQAKSATSVVELVREPSSPKPKARRKAFPDHLPRVRTIFDLKPEQKLCCGKEMSPMDEETTREFERVEISVVHEIVRKKYCCRTCQEHVKVAAGPDRVIDK